MMTESWADLVPFVLAHFLRLSFYAVAVFFFFFNLPLTLAF